MRILFILENYYPAIGGVETLFKTLIDKLDELGIESIILTTRHHDLPKVEKSGNTSVIRYRYFSRYLFTFLALFPALRYGRKVDFIHTTSYNAGLPASLAGLILRKPVVITFHEVWGKLWFRLPFFSRISKFFHFAFEQLLLRMPFYKFVAVSEFTENRLIKYGVKPSKIRTIYNGIDYEKWKAPEQKKQYQNYRFIFFGRLGISKGLDLLLPAFKQISSRHENVRLTLIIPRSPKSQLDFVYKQLESFPIDQKPRILHELEHSALIDILTEAQCTVIPSYSEGFGYTAVESMALNMPIISSGRGALKEVVGGNMIEMKTQDVKGLIDAMEKAWDHAWEYTEAKQYELNDTVDEYIKLYRMICNEKKDI
jgi:glycosyltransferase involved in cell wall biosynthesis